MSDVVEAPNDLRGWGAVATLPSGGSAWSGTASVSEAGTVSPVTTMVLDSAPFPSSPLRFLRLRVPAAL